MRCCQRACIRGLSQEEAIRSSYVSTERDDGGTKTGIRTPTWLSKLLRRRSCRLKPPQQDNNGPFSIR